jgi:hypothetical protein
MSTEPHPFIRESSIAKVALAQGAIYREDIKVWAALESNLQHISDHFGSMGVELVYAPDDGMAFLRQMDVEDLGIPVLIRRTRLSFEVTALGLVLRDELSEWEAKFEMAGIPTISRETIQQRMEPLLPQTNDERRREVFVDRGIKAALEFGFLAKTAEETTWEIKRIVKAKFSLDMLDDLRTRLKAFAEGGNTKEDDDANGNGTNSAGAPGNV